MGLNNEKMEEGLKVDNTNLIQQLFLENQKLKDQLKDSFLSSKCS